MLTKLQLAKHWRDWATVCRSNDWRTEDGRMVAGARAREGASLWHKLVWRLADQTAWAQARGVTVDDLRHATYVVATSKVPGWPKAARAVSSLKDMGNREFNRVLTLWALLRDPDDINAGMAWEHPENAERASLIASLRNRAPEATLRAVSGNAFETRFWEDLSLSQLLWLRRTIGGQQSRWAQPVEAAAVDTADQPY